MLSRACIVRQVVFGQWDNHIHLADLVRPCRAVQHNQLDGWFSCGWARSRVENRPGSNVIHVKDNDVQQVIHVKNDYVQQVIHVKDNYVRK